MLIPRQEHNPVRRYDDSPMFADRYEVSETTEDATTPESSPEQRAERLRNKILMPYGLVGKTGEAGYSEDTVV